MPKKFTDLFHMAIETVISTLSGHKKKRTFYKNLLIYAPTLIHDQTLKFITDHQDRPFFPFVLSVIPRAELTAPEEMMNKYVGKFKETPYQDVDDGPNYKIGGYMSQEHVTGTSKGRFCGDGGILDRQVGEIVAHLEKLGLRENTLIVFTSDNGPHLEGGADPEESNDLAAEYPDTVRDLKAIMESAHEPNPLFKLYASELD